MASVVFRGCFLKTNRRWHGCTQIANLWFDTDYR
jgi:hypothetical protein